MSETDSQLLEPTYDLASVNVDSLKEILLQLAQGFAFIDESTATAFEDKIKGLSTAGNPADAKDVEAKDKIAELEAQVAELKAAQGQGE
jgi:hypothetical protein